MLLQIIAFALYLLFMLYLRHRIKRRRAKKQQYNPFRLWKMVSVIRRNDGSTIERPYKRFEYWGQKTAEGEIIGIYHIHKKSPKEIKQDKLIAKFK